jgi:hypothetical protein
MIYLEDCHKRVPDVVKVHDTLAGVLAKAQAFLLEGNAEQGALTSARHSHVFAHPVVIIVGPSYRAQCANFVSDLATVNVIASPPKRTCFFIFVCLFVCFVCFTSRLVRV